ncbi:MAG TPA: dTMP kinase [Bacteroidales bacterium]|nr:dTMP kinase [Bacteroidales bacterium]HPS62707.1 dTMP kinase [Bacteroidales bacterium]
MNRPIFIALEGIDGSGKSTQARLLAEWLAGQGRRVHLTEEPTRHPIGALLRQVLRHEMEADHRTIAGLFVADRLDHLLNTTDGMLKRLHEGFDVITDRYYFSSYAYQGAHVPMDWVIQANAMSASLLRPDLTIFIDIPPRVAMERIRKGRKATELFETLENLTLVRAKFLEAFERLKDEEKVCIIDGNRAPEAVAEEIRQWILP